MLKIGILASGAGSDLPALFDAEIEGVEFVAVISNKQSQALEKAEKYGIDNYFISTKEKTREEFEQEVISILKEKEVDLILTIGFMRILTPLFLDAFPHAIFNIHPSLLPAFKGGMDKGVHESVLEMGCKVTGATIHLVNKDVDGGPIAMQDCVKIAYDETVDTLKEKVQKLEQKMLISLVENYRDQKIIFENNLIKILP